jgi:hypothetical protein
LADVALLPTESNPAAFGQYFPNGVADFLDEVEVAVSQIRQQYGCGFSYLMSASVQALSDQLRCPRVTFPENHSATCLSNQADS